MVGDIVSIHLVELVLVRIFLRIHGDDMTIVYIVGR